MRVLTEHWLSIGVGIFLLTMVLYGHYKGFLKMAVTMTALILSLIIVRVTMPYVTGLLDEDTVIRRTIGQGLLNIAGMEEAGETDETQLPVQQRQAIEKLKLPEQMKDMLLENNNNEIYKLLGVEKFLDYLGAYLANMVISVVGSVILFFILFILLRILVNGLGVLAKLPVLSGINQIVGALLGGIQGLFIIWIAELIVKACSAAPWAQTILAQIDASLWLSFLDHNNIFNWLFVRILNGLV